ncbi:MAG: hypothetical protein IPL88_08725 [Rhizobiales bacterium]|nr:hypothetical protein [Hyphomicrobiales bacterium]
MELLANSSRRHVSAMSLKKMLGQNMLRERSVFAPGIARLSPSRRVDSAAKPNAMTSFLKPFLAYPTPLGSGDYALAVGRRLLIGAPLLLGIAGFGAAMSPTSVWLVVGLQYLSLLIFVGLLAPVAIARARDADFLPHLISIAIWLSPIIVADLILRLFPQTWAVWEHVPKSLPVIPAPGIFAATIFFLVWLAPTHRPPPCAGAPDPKQPWYLGAISACVASIAPVTVWILQIVIYLVALKVKSDTSIFSDAIWHRQLSPPRVLFETIVQSAFVVLTIFSMLMARRADAIGAGASFAKRLLANPTPPRFGGDAQEIRRRLLIVLPVMLWIAGVGAAVPSSKSWFAVALQYPPFLIVVGLLAPVAYARAYEAGINPLFAGAAILLVPMIAADLILRLFPTVCGPWTYFLLWPAVLPAPIMLALSLFIVVWFAPVHRPPQDLTPRGIGTSTSKNIDIQYKNLCFGAFMYYCLMAMMCIALIIGMLSDLIANAIGRQSADALWQPPAHVSGVASLVFSGLMIVPVLVARRRDRRRQAEQMREGAE